MITIWKGIRRHEVELYEDIESMPIVAFSKMQKYQLISSGIGDSIGDFEGHFERLFKLVSGENKDKTVIELSNIRHLFWHIMNEISPESLAFACLVKTINGNEVGYSDGEISATLGKLKDIGLVKKMMDEKSKEVKKKSMTN